MTEDILAQKGKVTWERHSSAETARPQRLGDTGRRDWETIWHKRRDWEHRETSGRLDTEKKRETRPQSQRHSIWHPDTGRQAGDTPPSQRHSIWHPTVETGRQRQDDAGASFTASSIQTHRDKRETRPRSHPQRLEDTGRRDWETQKDKRETTPEPASQHLASDRRS